MDFNKFALSRDLLYICGAVTGIAIGFLFSLLKKGLDKKSRNRRIVLALLFFSGTVAGLALAFIVSMGDIFKCGAVLVTAGIVLLIAGLSVNFPRTVAFPLVLLCGFIVVWLGFSCLRFPVFANEPALAITYLENTAYGDSSYLIHFSPLTNGHKIKPGTDIVNEDEPADIIRINGKRQYLDFTITVINIDRHYPFIGGTNHGFIASIKSDNNTEFYDKSLGSPVSRLFFTRFNTGFLRRVLGIGFNEFSMSAFLGDMVSGSKMPVYIDSFDAINQY